MASNATQKLEYSPNSFDGKYPANHLRYIVGSCDCILCLADYYGCFVLLWNPSIRKFKELPPLEKPQAPFQEFPFGVVPVKQSGKFVSGTINWLASLDWARESPCVIVSLDLEKESYQEILQPDYGGVVDAHTFLKLGVLRDCSCMLCGHDVWLMKEYGNKESWTKLFTVSYMQDPSKYYCLTKALYIFEDDQVLHQSWGDWNDKLIVYDSNNGIFKFTEVEGIPKVPLEVCVESLISPCS